MLARTINYLTPAYLILLSAFFGVKALLLHLRLSTTTATFRNVWFTLFWHYSGPRFFANDPTISRIASQCRGKVLDIGPGTGDALRFLPHPPLITHIYGLEPNIHMHAQLQKAIDSAGLTEVYTILPFGAEDLNGLRGGGVEAGSVDTVLTIRVLCSLDKKLLDRAVGGLFECLKPGGQWLVFEHVRNGKCSVSGLLQGFYQILWPRMLAGCNINRRTSEILLRAGQWDVNDLVDLKEEEHWAIMPHICGRLVKSRE
ncbi:S-adenosyl-L-methionine-dependent methyltransferase [Tuber indicum]|nr:S-adenosyl-L-methionine-dependent methyltransferase [Tuber indicum]